MAHGVACWSGRKVNKVQTVVRQRSSREPCRRNCGCSSSLPRVEEASADLAVGESIADRLDFAWLSRCGS